ncbi:roadblock/LC7 domain-containing protein [Streptomyces sp. NPDC101227]|uniref:roadblock/LC7 domain-containing protein n=1 Tax=Streptomyces sp. NPDC101227 TaxID=3366136 RepID=UPI003800928C
MTNDVPTNGTGKDLSWLLENFLSRVPRSSGALLASRDGMRLAVAGVSVDQADTMAAVMSGLYSLAAGVGRIKGPAGEVRQVVTELDMVNMFVMSAGDGLPPGAPFQPVTDLGKVGSILGVLTEPDADPGVVGHEMAALITAVAEHLVTPTRGREPHLGDGQ